MADKIEGILTDDGEDGFIYPRYDGYCVSNVPHTVMELLGGKAKGTELKKETYARADTDGIERVVLLTVDSLGYDMWHDNAKNSELIKLFSRHGSVEPITTVFPSTTAAAVTTINTGLTPLQHGLLEWTLYFEEIGMVIHPLPFTALTKRGESLHERGVDPKILYNGSTIYQAMKRSGISSATLKSKHLIRTDYNKIIQKGADEMGYTSATDMVIKIRKTLENPKGPEFISAYTDMVDSMTHVYGPYTEESREETLLLFNLIERLLLRKISRGAAKKTLLIITADHGHISTDPNKTIYLNRYKGLGSYYAKDRAGERIPPTGGPRDVFLHMKENLEDEAYEYLYGRLGKTARIMRLNEIMERGLFGKGKPNKMFYNRLGNMMLLPYGNNTVWYEHVKGVRRKHIGHHGGMNRNEMLIPLAVARLSDLMR